jgi:hypothetical protein
MRLFKSIKNLKARALLKRIIFYFLLSIIIQLYPTHSAHADLLPPTIFTFEFYSKIDSPIEIIAIDLHTCSDLQCSYQYSYHPGQCHGNVCELWFYHITDYEFAQVIGTFKDGRQHASAIFVLPDWLYFGIQLTYKVFVFEDGMRVFPIPYQDQTPHFGSAKMNLRLVFGSLTLFPALIITRPKKQTTSKRRIYKDVLSMLSWLSNILFFLFFCAVFYPLRKLLVEVALLTLIIECTLSIVYAFLRNLPRMHFLTIILISNCTSIALLQFILSTGLYLYEPISLVIGEMLVWILEGLMLYILGRWTLKLSLRDAFLISLINNACSLGIGFLLYG